MLHVLKQAIVTDYVSKDHESCYTIVVEGASKLSKGSSGCNEVLMYSRSRRTGKRSELTYFFLISL